MSSSTLSAYLPDPTTDLGRFRDFRIVADDQLDSMPEPDWLIDGMLPANGLGMIFGPPESAKTFLALDLSLAIASQETWHGRPLKDGGVLYIAAEGIQSLKRRVAAWKYVHDVEGPAGLFVLPGSVQLMDEDETSSLAAAISSRLAEPLVLIVFDTLQRCMAGGDENNQGDAGKVIGNLDFLRQVTGATCLLIHHPGTVSGRPRGSTVFMGAMDAVWELREDDGARILECKKMKDAPHFDPMRFALQPVLESCVMAVSSGLTLVSSRLTTNQRKCLETLRDIDDGDGVLKGEWCDASGLPKASFHRTVKQLRDAGYVNGARRGRFTLTETGTDRLSQVSPSLRKVS